MRDIGLALNGWDNHIFSTLAVRLCDSVIDIIVFGNVEPIQHSALFCDDHWDLQAGSCFDTNSTRLHLHFMDAIPTSDHSAGVIQERNGERFILFHRKEMDYNKQIL